MPAVLRSEQRILDALPARMRADFIRALTLIAKAAIDAQVAEGEGDGKPKGRKRR
jgi:hypothetical protein